MGCLFSCFENYFINDQNSYYYNEETEIKTETEDTRHLWQYCHTGNNNL